MSEKKFLNDEIQKFSQILEKEESKNKQIRSHLHEHFDARENANAKIQKLKSHILETKDTIAQNINEVLQLHSKSDELKNEYNLLREEAQLLKKELDKSQLNKVSELRAVFSKESELSHLTQDFKRLQDKKNKISSDILEFKQICFQKKMEAESLVRKIETSKSEIIHYSKKSNIANLALESIKVTVREYQDKYSELEGKLNSINSHKNKRKRMVETLIEVKDNTISAIQKIGRKIDFTSNENRKLANLTNRINSQLIELKENLEIKKSQYSVAKRNNDYLNTKVDKVKSECKTSQLTQEKYEAACFVQAEAAKLKQNKINEINEKIANISKQIYNAKIYDKNIGENNLDEKLVKSVLKYENIKLELEQRKSEVFQRFDKIKLKRNRISNIESEMAKVKSELADFQMKDTKLKRIANVDTQKLADRESKLTNLENHLHNLKSNVALVEINASDQLERTLLNILSQGAETQRSIRYLRSNAPDYKKLVRFFINIYQSIDPHESFDCNFKINTSGNTVNFIVDNLTSFFDEKKTLSSINKHFQNTWKASYGLKAFTKQFSDGLVSLHIGIDMKCLGKIAKNEQTV